MPTHSGAGSETLTTGSHPSRPQEEYYLEQNVRTAIEIDEYTPGAPLTSMVDDIFFIVQKCGRRALATCNVQCACAVLGAGNGLLNSEVTAGLDAKWKVSAVAFAGMCCASTVCVALQTNACAAGCGDVWRLHSLVPPFLPRLLPPASPNSWARLWTLRPTWLTKRRSLRRS